MNLADGQTCDVKGSGAKPYVLKNTGGVFSCSCPAWRNQSTPIERRSCKHLKKVLGEAFEAARVGGDMATPAMDPSASAPEAQGEKAPPLLLAHRWENDTDLTGWWMSEKLDGVRAYWDGRRFLSRLGNEYFAPAWFIEGLPDFPLDGELWGGRKRFQRTVSIARRQDTNDDWRELTFLVFDAPGVDGPFEARLDVVRRQMRERLPRFARLHEHHACESTEHLRSDLARIEAFGGEGLMMRQPASRYEAGRSHTLLKVKSFKDDEARVVAHAAGAGRHKGRLGALVVELANGTRFNIGTGLSDAERRDPPAIGSIVTFRYQELSDGGVPRFPSFVGVRHDTLVR